MELGNLTIGVQVIADQLEAGINQAKGAIEDVAASGEQLDGVYQKAGASGAASGAQQAAAFAMVAAAAGAAFAKITGAVNSGVDAYKAYTGSVMGLQSVASHNNISRSELAQGLDQITDKFMNTTAASTALKNLLSRGYTLDQAVQTITRLKDAAAFGRQSSYEFADAVVSATEGLKNENSILVDNAGVTKNVAKMWQDWARERGMSVESMTKEQKILAEYNGIMQETAAQTGDLAKMGEGFIGIQTESANSTRLLAQEFGAAMSPMVGFAEGAKMSLFNTLRGIAEKAPEATSAVTSMGLALTGIVGVTKAVQGLQALKASLSGLSLSTGPLLGVAVAIGLIAAAITAAERSAEAARKKQEELQNTVKESSNNAQHITELANRYEELKGKTNKTLSDMEEMASIQDTLASQYGVTASAVEGLTGSYYSLEAAARAAAEAQWASAEASSNEMYTGAKDKLSDTIETYYTAYDMYKIQNKVQNLKFSDWFTIRLDKGSKDIFSAEVEATVKKGIDTAIIGLKAGGKQMNAETELILRSAVLDLSKGFTPEDEAAFETFMANAVQNMSNVLKNSDLDGLKESAGGLINKALTGGDVDAGAISKVFKDLKAEVKSFSNTMAEGLGNTDAASDLNKKAIDGLYDKYAHFFDLFGEEGGRKMFDGLMDGTVTVEDLSARLVTLQGQIKGASIDDIVNTEDAGEKSKKIQAITTAMGSLNTEYKKTSETAMNSGANLDVLGKMLEGWVDGVDLKDQEYDLQKYAEAIKSTTGVEISSREQLVDLYLQEQAIHDSNLVAQEKSKEALDAQVETAKELIDALPEEDSDSTLLGGAVAEIQRTQEVLNSAVPEIVEQIASIDAANEKKAASDARAAEAAAKANQKTTDSFSSLHNGFKPLTASAEDATEYVKGATKAIEDLEKEYESLNKAGDKAASIKKLAKEFRTGKISADQFKASLKALGVENVNTADEAEAYADRLGAQVHTSLQNVATQLTEYKENLQALQDNANVNGTIDADAGPALSAISAVIDGLNKVLALMGEAGLDTKKTKGGGGGGGGKKDSAYKQAIDALEHDKKMDAVTLEEELARLLAIQANYHDLEEKEALDLAERIHAIQKKMHEEALDMAYEEIEHKKAMGQINLEQEIWMLEQIKKKHELSNEERKKLDEKLYAAREQLRQEKEDKLSGVGEGLVEALRNQYEEMRETELEALEKSKEAIEKWSEERIKAIEAQIEAIDKLSDREDRDAKDAQERRKIAKLQEEINFEQDEYNRAQLQQQLEKAQEDRAERLRKQERDDQKQALKDQINDIKDEKDQKLQDIEDQKTKIEEIYNKLLEQTSLEAEARRMLLQKSQEEIVQFIGKFAPEYDALGRSLGEKWLTGFESVVGNVGAYFEKFNSSLQKIQDKLAQQALDVVDSFRNQKQSDQSKSRGNVNTNSNNKVEQHIVFNQPIETPAQAAKRLAQVAEDLVYA